MSFRLAAALLAAGTLLGPAQAQETDLRLRLSPNPEPYRLRVSINQVFTQTLLAQTRETAQQIEYVYALAVREIAPDGAMNVVVTYEHAAVSRDLSDKVFGEQPPGPAIAADSAARNRIFEALKGRSFSMRLDPRGKVLEVTGVEAVIDHLIDAMQPAGDEERQYVAHGLREQFGETATREAMERLLAFLPPESVAVGESWTRSQSQTKGLPLNFETTYTLKALEDGVATVDVRANVAARPEPIASPPGAGAFHYSLHGAQTGALEVDAGTGWPIRGNLVLQAYGHVAYDTGAGRRKTTAPLSVKTETTIGTPGA